MSTTMKKTEACYRIAGLTVKMESYGRTIVQAKPYKIDGFAEPDITIASKWEECREKYMEKYPLLQDEDGEYLFTGSDFYKKLLDFDGLMLHSSAVVVDGKAYLFSAPCGTGKSTHTGLWLKKFGNRACILNDDKPALRLQDGIWYAYGTPWSGKNDISVNIGVPVAGIAMIERGEKNEIVRWSGQDAIFAVYTQVNRQKDTAFCTKLLELLDKMFMGIPVWKLCCNMELEAAEVSYAAMSGESEEI